jgi:hypothetical protein
MSSTGLETPTARPLRWTKLLDWLADPREDLAREAAARRGMIDRLLSELVAQRDGYAD